MASDTFTATWEPRVGPQATRILRSRSRTVLLPVIFLIGLFVMAPTLRGATYAAAISALGVVTIGPTIFLRYRFNRRLAEALTSFIGVKVERSQVPSFLSVKRFDSWLRWKRSGNSPKQRSFLRGFIKVTYAPDSPVYGSDEPPSPRT